MKELQNFSGGHRWTNHGWREGKVPSDEAWRRVAPFREVDAARVRYLNRDECRRLVDARLEPLRTIVRGALLTGGRYSELARMTIADYHRESGTLLVRTSKAGKLRRVELTAEGLEFFEQITDGWSDPEPLFDRAGATWGKSHQQRPLGRGFLGPRGDNHGLTAYFPELLRPLEPHFTRPLAEFLSPVSAGPVGIGRTRAFIAALFEAASKPSPLGFSA